MGNGEELLTKLIRLVPRTKEMKVNKTKRETLRRKRKRVSSGWLSS